MKQSLRLGRVAGIPVGAHWTVIVILALIADILGSSVLPAAIAHQAAWAYWATAAAAAVAFAASLLAHELAHALVARRTGIQVRSITLWMLGGLTELGGQARSPGAELRIALAGPATSIAAAVAFAAAAAAAGTTAALRVVTAALLWLATVNLLLALFNMLPGAPLDGGRVLKAALWRHYGDGDRAGRAAGQAGRYLGAAIAVAGGLELVAWQSLSGLWLILIGWFLASAAGAEMRSAGAAEVAGVAVRDVMTAGPEIAFAWITAGDFIDQVARRSGQGVFPVSDFGGGLVGAVTVAQLSRLSPQERHDVRLGQLAMAVPAHYRAAPEDPAEPLFTRPPLGGELAAVVLSGGRIVGIVTADDLRRALRLASLHPTGTAAASHQRPAEPPAALKG